MKCIVHTNSEQRSQMFNTFIKVFLIGMITSLFLVGCSQSDGSYTPDNPVTKILLEGEQDIAVGMSAQLNAIVEYSDGSTKIVNDQANWESNNTDIATVDENGFVNSFASGLVTIIATGKENKDLQREHKISINDATLESIQIERSYNPEFPNVITDLEVTIDTEEYITAWGIYSDGTRRYINTDTVWWSTDQQIASINSLASSNVYGRDLGDANITAYFEGKEASIEVKVVPVNGVTLESIEITDGWGGDVITGESIDIEVDAKRAVVAYGHYSDGSRKDINAKVAWSSTDLRTAIIFDVISSYVYGVNEGQATITAQWQGVKASVTANIIPSTAHTLSKIEIHKGYLEDGNGEVLNTSNPLLLLVDDVQYVTAWAVYTDGSKEYVNTEAFWLSDDNSIASMPIFQTSSDVTAKALGSTTINATYSQMTGTAPVRVVEVVSVNLEGTDELTLGATTQYDVIATLNDGTEHFGHVLNDKVTWESNNTAIATVDQMGLITSKSEGNVKITTTGKQDTTKTQSKILAVTEATIVSLQIEKSYNPSVPQPISKLDVVVGTEEYITAWAIFSDGTRRYVNKDTVWWSTNQQIASINFLKSSNVNGRDLGNATIDAYYGGLHASIKVTVIGELGRTLTSIEIRDGWGNSNDITNSIIDIEVGNNAPVVAIGHYSDNTTEDINAKVAWSSSELHTAFIFDVISSYVYGIDLGTATIKAEWQGVEAFVTANIVVSTAPTLDSVEIQKGYSADGNGEVLSLTNPLVLEVNDVQYVTAWAVYSNGAKEYVNTDTFWLSTDNSIAHMDLLQRNSDVTAIDLGDANITATHDAKTATVPVIVHKPGAIIKENIVWDKEGQTVISPDELNASGVANAHAVWYYNDAGNGYHVGQKLSGIDFDFSATGANGATTYTNIYLKDTEGKNLRLTIGVDDSTAHSYLTWADVPAEYQDYTIRRYWELTTGLNIVEGNFFLRIGESSYVGSDPFSIDKFSVTTKP